MIGLIRNLSRGFIALVLLATAIGKLLDVPGFVGVLESYQAITPSLLWPLALGIPLAELALGGWLVLGWRLDLSGAASAAMHSVYAAWSAWAVLRGLKLANCGCFGVFLARPLGWSTVIEDGVMIAVSLGLVAASRQALSAERR